MIVECIVVGAACVGISWAGVSGFKFLASRTLDAPWGKLTTEERWLEVGGEPIEEPHDLLWRAKQLAEGAIVATTSPGHARDRRAELDRRLKSESSLTTVDRVDLGRTIKALVKEWLDHDAPKPDPVRKLVADTEAMVVSYQASKATELQRMHEMIVRRDAEGDKAWVDRYWRERAECEKFGIPHLPVSAYRPAYEDPNAPADRGPVLTELAKRQQEVFQVDTNAYVDRGPPHTWDRRARKDYDDHEQGCSCNGCWYGY